MINYIHTTKTIVYIIIKLSPPSPLYQAIEVIKSLQEKEIISIGRAQMKLRIVVQGSPHTYYSLHCLT